MKLIVLPATAADALIISPNLRIEDHAEVLACTGQEPGQVLPMCVEANRTWKAVAQPNGPPVALFGINGSVPWMVATPDLIHHQLSFLKQAKNIIQLMHHYGGPFLQNFVDARNDVHIRWLKYMGFTFGNLIPEYGAARIPFWYFYRRVGVSFAPQQL